MKLKVEYLRTDELKPYENNAKIHTEHQIEQIKNSIRAFGMNDPIGIWGEDNLIVEGHGRLMACQELGIEKVPVIRLDELSDEQRRAYTLVHNKTTLNSDFDYNVLDAELAEITEIDMADFGFEESDVDFSDFSTDFSLNSDDKPKSRTITLTLSQKQNELAVKCISIVRDRAPADELSNANGAAVYQIAREWMDIHANRNN